LAHTQIGRRNAWKMGIKDERQALVEAVDEVRV
jgi:hypothetical protein